MPSITAVPAEPGTAALRRLPVREEYRFRDRTTLTNGADDSMTVQYGRFQLHMERLGLGRRAMLLRLADEWLDDDAVQHLVAAVEGENRILRAQVLLRRLVTHAWLRRRLSAGSRPLLEIDPQGLGASVLPPPSRHRPGVRYRMSRLARLDADGEALSALSPAHAVAVGCLDPRVAGLLAVAAAQGCDLDRAAAVLGASTAVAGRVVDELLSAGIIEEPGVSTAPGVFWSPAELEVHHRSRVGRHSLPVGGTYRFQDRLAAEPLRRTFPDAPVTDLPEPDLDAVAAAEPALTDVIRARRSIRAHDDAHPIGLDRLAEFLYRVQATRPAGEHDGVEVGHRPYPGGGGLYELEIYPLVLSCQGLSPGLYHYDGTAHQLRALAPPGPLAERMAGYARAAAAMAGPPQVLLVITARVGRLMWKYEGIGYPMILKHCGVLTELMYLVATAMGLAPCALGSGDSAAFAELSGVDPLAEPAVADFALGSVLAEGGLRP
ncbi:SagB family peptide dehydrogenase [Actinoplanes sp. NEAU-A12]|uniref:SagB family peptide dehydrogenase n=1 Tax=Actinoplanes sandaracinus TaxID=3045177 RepID=A0ABT6X026_9ACTN|nr:SagB family peptide dehydrogenase [Actinoplanes sandaracinus]MDI6105348.1 SagB family peptide dehydrogenase [Actinoplanes sandaracinus]